MTTPLITRLEEAAEGSWRLDAEIEVLFSAQNLREALARRDYTTSLDAALALAERVLPPDPNFSPQTPSVGWKISLYRGMIPTDQRGGWFANVRRHATDGFEGASESPALALCLAILRANHKDKP